MKLNFAGPGPGAKLRLEYVTCKLRILRHLTRLVEFFDGNNALYLPMVFVSDRFDTWVASMPVTFFTVAPT